MKYYVAIKHNGRMEISEFLSRDSMIAYVDNCKIDGIAILCVWAEPLEEV